MDADAALNKPLAAKYGVKSFPTIKFFAKGGEILDYEGGRTEADFVAYLNEKCGTNRAVGGGLNDIVTDLHALYPLFTYTIIGWPSPVLRFPRQPVLRCQC